MSIKNIFLHIDSYSPTLVLLSTYRKNNQSKTAAYQAQCYSSVILAVNLHTVCMYIYIYSETPFFCSTLGNA